VRRPARDRLSQLQPEVARSSHAELGSSWLSTSSVNGQHGQAGLKRYRAHAWRYHGGGRVAVEMIASIGVAIVRADPRTSRRALNPGTSGSYRGPAIRSPLTERSPTYAARQIKPHGQLPGKSTAARCDMEADDLGSGRRSVTWSARLAEIAARERHTHLAYLAEILSAELDDRSGRRRTRRIADAKFRRLKRLADFNADAVPSVSPAQLAHLATGAWIDDGEPLVLLGDSGTGKTPPADRTRPGSLRARPTGPIHHLRSARQRTRRGRRPAAALPRRRPLQPPRPTPARRARPSRHVGSTSHRRRFSSPAEPATTAA
jgi:hypothetical protein